MSFVKEKLNKNSKYSVQQRNKTYTGEFPSFIPNKTDKNRTLTQADIRTKSYSKR